MLDLIFNYPSSWRLTYKGWTQDYGNGKDRRFIDQEDFISYFVTDFASDFNQLKPYCKVGNLILCQQPRSKETGLPNSGGFRENRMEEIGFPCYNRNWSTKVDQSMKSHFGDLWERASNKSFGV